VIQFPLKVENEIFLIQVFWKKRRLQVEILKDELMAISKKIIANYILEWFDVKRDLTAFNKICKKDKLLSLTLLLLDCPHIV